jgi:hypothetical protein
MHYHLGQPARSQGVVIIIIIMFIIIIIIIMKVTIFLCRSTFTTWIGVAGRLQAVRIQR